MPLASLPELPKLATISQRLQDIFPEGMENRTFFVRDIAAKTVFVMLYAGAVEGQEQWVRPNQIARMTDAQCRKTGVKARLHWVAESLRPGKQNLKGRWYADNTREPIRDETLRAALIRTGAAIERAGLPTTSAKPRYALAADFAALFDESLKRSALSARIAEWQQAHLSPAALKRVTLLKAGLAADTSGKRVEVRFPNGEARRMAAGTSSLISKAVIEEFATGFLRNPGVVFLSEPGNKVVVQDDALARSVGLVIDPARNLPDIILVDLGIPEGALVVFVEVVATDGAINAPRKAALLAIAREAGFKEHQVAFVTAFLDRSQQPVRKALGSLAWGSFVWFAAEPDRIAVLHDNEQTHKALWELMSAAVP
jgi:BsuBI/PstI restriction endonuclease domain/BsuBI/PstI restriction endonuclease HTH domain